MNEELKRMNENINEVNDLISGSEWEYEDYDEYDGYVFIKIYKKQD